MLTVVKYRERWSDPRLIFLVLHNNDLNQVTWEQRVLEGDPRFDASQEIPDFSYAGYAESIGRAGIRVDHPDGVGPAWDEALSAGRPVVLEAITDPEVPPLPPQITFEQAVHFAEAVARGDSRRGRMIRGSIRQRLAALIPGG